MFHSQKERGKYSKIDRRQKKETAAYVASLCRRDTGREGMV